MDSSPGPSIGSATHRWARSFVLGAAAFSLGFLLLCQWFPPAWLAFGLWLLMLVAIAGIMPTKPGLTRWIIFVVALYSSWGCWGFWNLPPEGNLFLFFPHHRWQKLLNVGESGCLVAAAVLMVAPGVTSQVRDRLHAPAKNRRRFSGSALVALGAFAGTIALALPRPWLESGSSVVYLPLLPGILGLRFLLARRLHFLDAAVATVASLLAGLISMVVTLFPMGYVPMIVPLSRTTRGQLFLVAGGCGTWLLFLGTVRVWKELFPGDRIRM